MNDIIERYHLKTIGAMTALALSSLATTWEALQTSLLAAAQDTVGAAYKAKVTMAFGFGTLVLRTVKGVLDARAAARAKGAQEVIQNADITTQSGAPLKIQ